MTPESVALAAMAIHGMAYFAVLAGMLSTPPEESCWKGNAMSQSREIISCPDPLVDNAGHPVTTPEQWRSIRRGEILELFRRNIYGRNPVDRPASLRIQPVGVSEPAMGGAAVRRQFDIVFRGPGGEGRIRLLLFLPKSAVGPVPAFLLLCNRERENIDPDRTVRSPFWPVEEGVARGYAMAAIHVEDIDPDHDDGFRNGVHALFDPPTGRGSDAWGTIGAWPWSLRACFMLPVPLRMAGRIPLPSFVLASSHHPCMLCWDGKALSARPCLSSIRPSTRAASVITSVPGIMT